MDATVKEKGLLFSVIFTTLISSSHQQTGFISFCHTLNCCWFVYLLL